LDKAYPHFGYENRRRTPHGLIQEYLNATDQALWGVVFNGYQLRLLRDNPSLTRPAYIEADLQVIFEEQIYSDFATFWLLFHGSRLLPQKDGPCILEIWRQKSYEIGKRALTNLRLGVVRALEFFGNGFLRHPDNRELREALRSGNYSKESFFQELLRLVYRLLFLLTVEDRNLLLIPTADDTISL
jgi:hypothetical protein